jgi:hypothetical protein
MCNEQNNNETEGKTLQVMCEQLNTCGEEAAWSWMGNPRQHPRSRRSGYPRAMPLAACRTISFCRIPQPRYGEKKPARTEISLKLVWISTQSDDLGVVPQCRSSGKSPQMLLTGLEYVGVSKYYTSGRGYREMLNAC